VVTEDVLLACIFDVAITGEAIWAARAVKADPYAPGVHIRPRLLSVPLDRPNRMRRIGALVTGVQDKTLVWEASPGLTLHRVRNNVVDVEVPNQDGIYEITAYLASRPEIKDTITVVVKPPTYRIWDGGGDGRRFSDCRNWMEDLCPDPDSELFIITSTSRTQELLMDIPTGTAYSLTLEGRANLSGSLALTGGGRLYGDISLSGTLRVGEGSVLTLQGSLQWHSGALLGPGTFVNQGLLRVVNTSYGKDLCAALRNEGEIRVESSYLYFGCSNPNLPGLLTNAQGATLALQVPQGSAYTIYNNHGSSRLANQGSLVKTGAGTFEVRVPLDNQGEVEVQEGVLYPTGGGRLLGGEYRVAENATMRLAGTWVGGGQGQVQGSLQLWGNLQAPEGQEAILNFTGDGLQWHSGALLGPGTFVNQGLLRVVNTSYGKDLCAALRNEGEIRVESNLGFGCSNPNLPGLLTNAQGATLALQVPQGTTYVIFNNHGSSRLANQGSLVKAGAGTFEVRVPLDNQGEVEVQEGVLYPTGGGRLLGGGVPGGRERNHAPGGHLGGRRPGPGPGEPPALGQPPGPRGPRGHPQLHRGRPPVAQRRPPGPRHLRQPGPPPGGEHQLRQRPLRRPAQRGGDQGGEQPRLRLLQPQPPRPPHQRPRGHPGPPGAPGHHLRHLQQPRI
jgi:hypothetical protein